MNYGELKAQIAAYAHRNDLVNQIPGFVELAHARIYRDARLPEMIKDIEITPTANPQALPDDYVDLRELSGGAPQGNRYLLQSINRHQLANYNTGGPHPLFYALTGNSIEIVPPTETTLRLVYWSRLAFFNEDTDTNAVLDRYPYLYLYGSLIELYNFTQDVEERAKVLELYTADLELANLEAERTRWGEAPVSSGASSWYGSRSSS